MLSHELGTTGTLLIVVISLPPLHPFLSLSSLTYVNRYPAIYPFVLSTQPFVPSLLMSSISL